MLPRVIAVLEIILARIIVWKIVVELSLYANDNH
jgi:hypothetical protein